LIAEEIVNQEDQRAIEVLLQTNINESLKVNIDQYLEVVDLTKRHIVSTNEAFNGLKIWMQYLERQKNKEFDMKNMRIMQRKVFNSKIQKNN
ncbi:6478_t:CDS:2, partial [Funneliformis geosporum]